MVLVKSILTLFFLLAGSVKLTGWLRPVFTVQLDYFRSYGLSRFIMALVGLAEMGGAAALWLTPGLGALLLALVSLGALACHLRFDTWKEGVPAMVTLTLSLLLYCHPLPL
ncbi:DoxX family protein [Ferrimonas futtsuensis]|uniref:DoxX family protein n=1 Tax=Ferrimonas futtsuensis TaxID=364764 RepID=UPI000425A7D3|nr:DoxX family protein [Ferrimonas futtsuensis]